MLRMRGSLPPTIEWCNGVVRLIDQRRLPGQLAFIEARTVDQLCEAISDLAIRGAPALGAAGAMGVAPAQVPGEPRGGAAARTVAAEDVQRNRRIGQHGAPLIPSGGRVLTHCNAGGLACVGYGTAIGVIRAAWESNR